LIILGLNAFHGDSSAALMRDGKLIAAAEEERFRRLKHWAGFPSQSIAYCLREAGLSLSDVDHVAVNQNGRAHLLKKAAYVAFQRPDPALVLQRLKNRGKRKAIPELLTDAFPGTPFHGESHHIEHHLLHLFSAFYVSPFKDAAVVSVDGFGDFSSAAWGVGHGNDISVDGRVFFPHSLGIFYEALTQWLGFPHYGDEYKVMGLAPYGKPAFMDQMRRIVRLKRGGAFELDLRYFLHHREVVPYQWDNGSPEVGDLFSPAMEELLGPRRRPKAPLESRHHDVARSAQVMYEEAFFHLITNLQERTGLTDIALAGGCAANSVANGKIRRQTKYERVYVQSAAGDAGGAIGAAFALWQKLGGERSFVMDHAYWDRNSPTTKSQPLSIKIETRSMPAGCALENISDEAELCRRTAQAVADGKSRWMVSGPYGVGPTRFGQPDYCVRPTARRYEGNPQCQDQAPGSFRPFAPSILDGAVGEWFEEDDAVPFMMQVFQIREPQRARIPAVTHVDGSGRLQTVYRHTNPRYYRLIEAFRDIAGIPIVLNTSFNENEPVVCNPQEALDCFLRTKMDVLVLGDVMISRSVSSRIEA